MQVHGDRLYPTRDQALDQVARWLGYRDAERDYLAAYLHSHCAAGMARRIDNRLAKLEKEKM